MEKKVGKILFVFLLVSNYIAASQASIILRMQDMNHKPIDQAMQQVPFILQVELKNLDAYTDLHLIQYITGIENFKASRSITSHNISIDDGKKTTKYFYNFILRSDKKGKFTLGPFHLKDTAGNLIQSNRLIIPVGDELIYSQESGKDKYFVTANFNKERVYVGEKVVLSVKFYDRLFVEDLHIQLPDFKNLYSIKNQKNVTKNMVVIDGEEYSVTQWLFDMYATEPGSTIVQDIHAIFFAPELDSKFTFGRAFDFFRSLHKSEQHVVAQPLKIDIIPLPDHHDASKVDIVGQFSKFIISVNQNYAPVGQGIVLTVKLFGDGNFEMIPLTPLILPEGFNYYDSNLVTIDENRTFKSADFIVQVDTPGSYSIASQSLIYFDPVDLQYKKIESNSLDITILPIDQNVQSLPYSDTLLEESVQDSDILKKEIEDFSIIEKGFIHNRLEIMIPLYLYQMIIWLLFFMLFLYTMHKIVLQKYFLQYKILNKFIYFYRAEKSFKQAIVKKDMNKLRLLFMKLFSYLTNIPVGQITDSDMVQYLRDKDFSDDQIEVWKKLYQQILQVSFGLHNQSYQGDLFEEAFKWVQKLKDKA
jgi:hypothetical protein